MTREIEFRAKRGDTKEWIFGYYYNSLGEFPCIIETSQEGYLDDAFDVRFARFGLVASSP
jgi:hypothetical protein